jgi:hypothetical protein
MNEESVPVHIDLFEDGNHTVTSPCSICKKEFTRKLNYWQEDGEVLFYPNMEALATCDSCGGNITLVGNNKVWELSTPPNDLKK